MGPLNCFVVGGDTGDAAEHRCLSFIGSMRDAHTNSDTPVHRVLVETFAQLVQPFKMGLRALRHAFGHLPPCHSFALML